MPLMRLPVFPSIVVGRYSYDEVALPQYGIWDVRLIDRPLMAGYRRLY